MKNTKTRHIRKGRDAKLIDRRDRLLLSRYYELTEVKRIRFDDVLFILSENEFFVSESRIERIIASRSDLLDELKTGKKIFQCKKQRDA